MKSILVVDDDPVEVKLLKEVLEKNDFQVKVCTEAPEGLQCAMDDHPDVILLDVMMPIINGFNFCQLLKNQEKQQHIPIIMVTSRDDEEDIEIGKDMGADAYVTKPVDTQNLIQKINEVIKNSQKNV